MNPKKKNLALEKSKSTDRHTERHRERERERRRRTKWQTADATPSTSLKFQPFNVPPISCLHESQRNLYIICVGTQILSHILDVFEDSVLDPV
jgi:hypothetical protein